MNYSKIDLMSIVDGEGCRVTLFVSDCMNHCNGCFNPETWNFDYGQTFFTIIIKNPIDSTSINRTNMLLLAKSNYY